MFVQNFQMFEIKKNLKEKRRSIKTDSFPDFCSVLLSSNRFDNLLMRNDEQFHNKLIDLSESNAVASKRSIDI